MDYMKCVEIKKSPDFLKTAKMVSDYLKDLPLSKEQNNDLIELLIQHEEQGRRDAIQQGFALGAKYVEDELKQTISGS